MPTARAPDLPPFSDPVWRTAPAKRDGARIRHLPFRPPFVPDVGARLRWLRRQHRLVLLADGFPGRLVDGRVVLHPMDARYLLEALLAAQAERPRRRLHGAIARTAAAVVGRAEPLGDALALWYRDTASSMTNGAPHVSGLPQAYYALALARAARLLGDPALDQAADQFFMLLLVPVEDGGVLYRGPDGPALAQVPTRPRDLVLNGWLSMLVSIHHYAELRDSRPARELFAASLPVLRRLLPLYDVPELRLSRYGLTGPIELRLEASRPNVRITDLRVAIPGEGEIRLPVREGGRWSPRAFPEDVANYGSRGRMETLTLRDTSLRCVAVLSRAAYPEPNRLRFRIPGRTPASVTVAARIGRYDMTTAATVDRRWVELGTTTPAQGSTLHELALPYEPIDLFAYPTRFTAGGRGARLNTYHGTHVVRLRQLAEITGDAEFARWADRWAGYARQWSSMPELEGGTTWTPEGEL